MISRTTNNQQPSSQMSVGKKTERLLSLSPDQEMKKLHFTIKNEAELKSLPPEQLDLIKKLHNLLYEFTTDINDD